MPTIEMPLKISDEREAHPAHWAFVRNHSAIETGGEECVHTAAGNFYVRI